MYRHELTRKECAFPNLHSQNVKCHLKLVHGFQLILFRDQRIVNSHILQMMASVDHPKVNKQFLYTFIPLLLPLQQCHSYILYVIFKDKTKHDWVVHVKLVTSLKDACVSNNFVSQDYLNAKLCKSGVILLIRQVNQLFDFVQ